MHRYRAPKHTSSVFTSSGEHRADAEGIIALGPDAPQSDHAQLRAAGCVAVEEDAAEQPDVEPAAAQTSEPETEAAAAKDQLKTSKA